jgi:GNAT superfamily N-acetyltransferase
MRITIEHSIDVGTQEEFLEIYREAFAPLEPLAAARQALTDEEFRGQMNDPGVFKFLAWDKDERPCAMAIMAADLAKVPWISPQYFAARFPEHFARGAIYYYQALLVRADHRKTGTAGRMLEAVITKVAEDQAVAAIDCCRFTVEEVQFPAMVSAVASQLCHFEEWEIDTQHYYAYRSTGLLEPVIDLRDSVLHPAEPLEAVEDDAGEHLSAATVDGQP